MQTISGFLSELGFLQTWEEMAPVEEAFLDHMQKGLAGQPSSMPMLPAYLGVEGGAQEARDVIVMDAGGTNLRVSLLRLAPGQKPQTLYHHVQPMPGKAKPLEREAFFLELAKAVAPVADQSDRIGFCFSFPCRIRPDYDGEILYLDKEITVDNIEGALVAQGLRDALATLGAPCHQRVVILNDTVAALLGALAEHPASCFSGFIGMILGTGTNCCYLENNERVTKEPNLCRKPGKSIINMEAGAFGAMRLTQADVLLSHGAKVSTQNLMEKMVSGAYQGPLFDALLQCANRAGCFSSGTQERLAAAGEGISAVDISAFMAMPAHPGRIRDLAATPQDALALYQLADALLERAAKLAVMNLTAIMRATGTGVDPLMPVCVAVEGTTYMKNHLFRQKILAHLIHYTQNQRGYFCRVLSTPEANLVGSAVAATVI